MSDTAPMSSRRLRLLSAAVLAGGAAALSVGACTPPQPYASCGNVGQQPNSDVGAWNINAHQTDCATARTVANAVYHSPSTAVPQTFLTWHCTAGIPTQGLGSFIWCNGPGGGVITWTNV